MTNTRLTDGCTLSASCSVSANATSVTIPVTPGTVRPTIVSGTEPAANTMGAFGNSSARFWIANSRDGEVLAITRSIWRPANLPQM